MATEEQLELGEIIHKRDDPITRPTSLNALTYATQDVSSMTVDIGHRVCINLTADLWVL